MSTDDKASARKGSGRSQRNAEPLKMPDVSPEDALRAFMQVDPGKTKVKKGEKEDECGEDTEDIANTGE